MKKIWFILAITGLVFSSCGNKKKQDNSGSHIHKDGNVHANDAHDHENTAKPDQESFEVKAENDTQGHEHGDETGLDNNHEHAKHK